MKNPNLARKKRVLYLITKGNWGGAQRYVYDLATTLPKDAFMVAVAMGKGSELKERLKGQSVHVHRIHSLARDMSLSNDLRSFVEIYRLLKKEHPDVLHVSSSKAGGLGAFAARLAGVPCIIFTAHGWAFNEPRGKLTRALIWLAHVITAFLSHSVITVSKRDYTQGHAMPFTKKKMVLIHNGIRTSELLDRTVAQQKLLGRTLSTDTLIIGTIAELHPNKDIRSLIRACSLTKARGKIHCIIIGDGEEYTVLSVYAKGCDAENTITFAGKRDSAAQFLSAFDIFVLPSVKEGLPYVLLEAGSAGLPVVATRVGGIPEIIEDGVSGILVPPRSPEAIATALEALIEDRRVATQYGAALKKKISEEFSLDRMVQETIEVYEGAVDKKL